MSGQIINYFEKKEIFNKNQFGFRKNKNTVLGILGRCQNGPGYWAIKYFIVLPSEIRELPVNKFKDKTNIGYYGDLFK